MPGPLRSGRSGNLRRRRWKRHGRAVAEGGNSYSIYDTGEGQLHLVVVHRNGRIGVLGHHDARLGVDVGLPANQNGGDDSGDHKGEGNDEQDSEAGEAALDLFIFLSEGAVLLGEGNELLGRERTGTLRVKIAKALLFFGEVALVIGVPFLRYDGEALVVLGGSRFHFARGRFLCRGCTTYSY